MATIVREITEHLPQRLLFLLVISGFFSMCGLVEAQNDSCQTPDRKGLIIFEPYYWLIESGQYASMIHDWNHYGDPPNAYEWRKQLNAPNPAPDTTCNLSAFLNLMNRTDIGILYIRSHGRSNSISLEFHMTEASCDSAYEYYRDSLHIPECYLSLDSIPGATVLYGNGLTADGIEYYCSNLGGALVFADACSSAWLNPSWGAKIAMGWDDVFYVLSCAQDHFFMRMLGHWKRAQGNTNYCREAHDAAEHTKAPPGAHLICYQTPGQEMDIVLSPIIIEHYPGYQPDYGHYGQLVFDCKMHQYNPASYVIALTGPPNFHLQDIQWIDDYTLKYFLPETASTPCWIDFVVEPTRAYSYDNHSQLDGNTNPPASPRQNGVAPNQDHFNWTSTDYRYRFADFENGVHNQAIGTDIPGIDFRPPSFPGGHLWRYKEPTPNSRVYPYHHGTDYPVYWFDGRFAAWIGVETPDPYPITAKIIFEEATASLVCFGYTSTTPLSIKAYNEEEEEIMSKLVGDWQIYEIWLFTHSIRQVRVSPNPDHAGESISYITLYGNQNQFAIDNLVVYDFLMDGFQYLPIGYDPLLQEIEKVQPGDEPNSYNIEVLDIMDSLRVICYWDSEKDAGIRLELCDPNDDIIFEEESKKTPIIVHVVSDPMAGNWKVNINSLEEEGKAYPYAVIGAVTYEPLVDCYIEEEDICFDPEEPELGEKVWISAKIHCGDLFSKPVEQVLVRSYLGDPDLGNKIGRDVYALNIEPGSVDTVYFYFDSEDCQEISPCNIYITIDPEEELEEYDEDNNIAYKEMTFSP